MTNNTNGDARPEQAAFGASTGPSATEQSFRDLGIDLSPIALEKALTRAQEMHQSGLELTEGRLKDIADEATTGLEALDDVVTSFR
jgi:isopropylmalate/homocitrate/citramalate synthase